MTERKFYVISYDIVDDRKRTKVAETMKDYGMRVQKSVFEARLDHKMVEKMLSRLKHIIDDRTDNILVYLLCEGCVPQKRFLGVKILGEEKDFRLL